MTVTPKIIEGRWTRKSFPGPKNFAAHCQRLARACARAGAGARTEKAVALFRVVELRSEILQLAHNRIVGMLLRFVHYPRPWVRAPHAWWPASRLPLEQFDELVRHLFERYPAPDFFRSSWWSDGLAFDWFVHLASGNNIRTAPMLPTTLSRRAAHELAKAPASLTPRQALRWAQLRAFGADRRLARAILQVRDIATDFSNDWLWLPLYEKMARAEWTSTERVQPLLEFVRHTQPALQGRSICNVLRAMERWQEQVDAQRDLYHELGATTTQEIAELERMTWSPMSTAAPHGDGEWEITELCSFLELFQEAAQMRHCVASYARDCREGEAAIWSLRGPAGRATLAVCPHERVIFEARGPNNRAITPVEREAVSAWAAANELRCDFDD